MPDSRRSLGTYYAACWAVAVAWLSVGTIVYVACRPQQPLLLTTVGIPPASFVSACHGLPAQQWLPTFAHVGAFSFATCALMPARLRSPLIAAGGWAAANLAWEFRTARSVVDRADALAALLAFAFVVTASAWLLRVRVGDAESAPGRIAR